MTKLVCVATSLSALLLPMVLTIIAVSEFSPPLDGAGNGCGCDGGGSCCGCCGTSFTEILFVLLIIDTGVFRGRGDDFASLLLSTTNVSSSILTDFFGVGSSVL